MSDQAELIGGANPFEFTIAGPHKIKFDVIMRTKVVDARVRVVGEWNGDDHEIIEWIFDDGSSGWLDFEFESPAAAGDVSYKIYGYSRSKRYKDEVWPDRPRGGDRLGTEWGNGWRNKTPQGDALVYIGYDDYHDDGDYGDVLLKVWRRA